MIKSNSNDNLENFEHKKRKRELSITSVEYLNCDNCGIKVYNYRMCIGEHIYCSRECFNTLLLKAIKSQGSMSFTINVKL